MTTLCLTGWQQPANALACFAPDAQHFDYAAYDNVQDMFAVLPREPKLAIGWSLGGQLLVRAIAGGHIKPKALLLLGVPFQHVADEHFPHGVLVPAAAEYRDNYCRNPEGTLAQFQAYIGYGDKFAKRIIRAVNQDVSVWKNGLFWLDELARNSCRELSFSAFPETVIVHGAEDKVINPASAKAFADVIPKSEVQLWPDCGHAPHLHNPEALSRIVAPYV
jgi:pimeloyl-[acyl-carrier protein] methyl ester esterase